MTAGREYNHKRITALLRHNAQKMALNWTLGNA